MFIILGSGCRENIIVNNLRRNDNNVKIICISNFINRQIYDNVNNYYNSNLSINDIFILIIDIKNNNNEKIIVIPGSETYLKDTLVDKLIKNNIDVIGPIQQLALIETSKSYCRNYLKYNNLDNFQPKFMIFEVYFENYIINFIEKLEYNFVVKPDGLYGGKGVKIFNKDNYLEGLDYCKEIMVYHKCKIIIEEKLYGEEFILMSFCDGKSIKHMPICKDYKDLNKDSELKTGGMGSILLDNFSLPFLNEIDIEISKNINKDVMINLSRNTIGYKGILYGSFMKTENGIKVIEYNARFGDSECLNVIKLLKTPLSDIFHSICNGSLDKLNIEYYRENCVCRYIVPLGYPVCKNKNQPFNFKLDKTVLNENIVMGGLHSNEVGIYKTTGSRTLCVLSKNKDINICIKEINDIIKNIQGEFHYRDDIGLIDDLENINNSSKILLNKTNVYKDCGVNIDEGDKMVNRIKKNIQKTYDKNIEGKFGDYCGFYNLKNIVLEMKEPLIVTSVDGVGTKTKFILKVLGVKEGLKVLAHDIVNHCVNDIIVKGVIPLYFTDYISSNELIIDNMDYFIEGLSEACLLNNISILGGETAELPNTYYGNNYEIVGNITGIIEKDNIIDGKNNVKEGDLIYGIRSSGIHTNGYSVINKLYEKIQKDNINMINDIKDKFITSHRSYLKELNHINSIIKVNAYSHITGGGYDNIKRVIDDNLGVNLKVKLYEPYCFIQKVLNISDDEMYNIFNCGYGMLLFVNKNDIHSLDNLIKNNEIVFLGNVTKRGIEQIRIVNESY